MTQELKLTLPDGSLVGMVAPDPMRPLETVRKAMHRAQQEALRRAEPVEVWDGNKLVGKAEPK